MSVIWTKKAEESFTRTIEFIFAKFTQKEADRFILEVFDIINVLEQFPKMFPTSKKLKQSRKATLHPNCTMFYRVHRKHITILLFWDNRMDDETINQ